MSKPQTWLAFYKYDDTSVGPNQVGRRSWLYNSTDLNNEYVKYEYDGRGRVITETRRIASWNYPTSYSYDTANQVRSLTYPDGEVVTTAYDAAGQVTSVSGLNSYLTSQTYDVARKPLTLTLGNGAVTRYSYESLSQRLQTLQTAPVSGTGSALSYGYDAFGNVVSLADSVTPADNQTFKYDNLNRLSAVTGPYAQTFGYDDQGNLTARDGQSYTYSATKPHAVRRLAVDGLTDRFDYDGAGNLTGRGCYILASWPMPWVCRQGLAYDGEGRLSTLSDTSLGSETYRYDGDGALVRRTTPTSAAVVQFTEPFSATSSAWTTTAASTWGQPTQDGHTTTLKTVGTGNWTTTVARTATVAHGQTVRVAFKLSQPSSQAVLALDTGSGSTYHRFGVYENGGKLYQAVAASTSGGTSYINPTVLVDSFAAGVWYILELTVDDGAGDRVSVWQADTPSVRYEARWEAPSGQVWTFRHWAYAGTTWLDDYQEVRPAQAGSDARIVGKHYEYDSVSATQTKRYYANGVLLATRTGTTLTYVQGDHLGSTSTLTNSSGAVVSRERYSAFGERRRTSDTLITDQLYTGQRLNVLSNLYHYSDGGSAGRFYDPLLGRFIQADSVTPGNTSIALNRYAYANNSPIVFSDPSGHAAWKDEYEGEYHSPAPGFVAYDVNHYNDWYLDTYIRAYNDAGYSVQNAPYLAPQNASQYHHAYYETQAQASTAVENALAARQLRQVGENAAQGIVS